MNYNKCWKPLKLLPLGFIALKGAWKQVKTGHHQQPRHFQGLSFISKTQHWWHNMYRIFLIATDTNMVNNLNIFLGRSRLKTLENIRVKELERLIK